MPDLFPTFVVGSLPRPQWVRDVIEDRKTGRLGPLEADHLPPRFWACTALGVSAAEVRLRQLSPDVRDHQGVPGVHDVEGHRPAPNLWISPWSTILPNHL